MEIWWNLYHHLPPSLSSHIQSRSTWPLCTWRGTSPCWPSMNSMPCGCLPSGETQKNHMAIEDLGDYPLVNSHNYGKSRCLMGNFTIHCQRVKLREIGETKFLETHQTMLFSHDRPNYWESRNRGMQPRISRNGKDTVYRGSQDEKWFQDVIDKVYIWKKNKLISRFPFFHLGVAIKWRPWKATNANNGPVKETTLICSKSIYSMFCKETKRQGKPIRWVPKWFMNYLWNHFWSRTIYW